MRVHIINFFNDYFGLTSYSMDISALYLPVFSLSVDFTQSCSFVFCGHLFWLSSLESDKDDGIIALPIHVVCVMLAISFQQNDIHDEAIM